MNTRWIKLSIVVLVVGLLGFAALSVNAQGMWGGQGGNDNSLIAVAADALGMEQADLVAELQSGKTIAQLAEAKGVALDTIVDAFIKNHADWLATRVASGAITQESADAMLALMKTHVTERLSESFTPQGFGQGMGFHMGNNAAGRGMMGNGIRGMGSGMMGRGMHGMGFNDADGDGWCDNCPNQQGANS